MIGLTPHQTKALNIEDSISLTANAGSGKTFVLAQRYLEIILNTDTKISQVAAITFTEKAAGELYTRISAELNRIIQTTNNLQLKQRVEKIRKQIVSAKISTIHSFCIDLLKEYPVEASVDANFTPINEQRTQEIINLTIEKSIKSLLRDPVQQDDIKLLIRLLGSKSNLVKELTSLIQKRKNVTALISDLYASSEDEIAEKYAELFKLNLKNVFNDALSSVIHHLSVVNEKVLDNNNSNALASEVKLNLADIEEEPNKLKQLIKLKDLSEKILTRDGSVRKQNYLSTHLREGVEESIAILENIFEDLAEIDFSIDSAKINNELIKYALALVRIFGFVLKEFENSKSELGVLDFEDILIKTKQLLDIKSVKKSLADKYKYLLVDEYQDTNEIQYNIFLPLLDYLRRGNLFIVGDEKQSIYRFRDAELKVFAQTKSDIQQISGQKSLLTLPDSFRLAPSICFFVNSIFKKLFREPRLFFNEVESSDLICARPDEFQGRIEFLITEDNEANESELVAKRILKLKSENKDQIENWNDIAVLVRKRVAFSDLQKAFIKYNIPFNIVGGTGFYQQQSISDIYNYFSFLLNDKDDAALIGLLRSPFFFVSDSEILELSSFEGEYFWEKLKSAAKEAVGRWENIFSVLSENISLVLRISTPKLLRKILAESYFVSALSSRVNGMQEISNLNKLITITNNFFNEEFNTIYDYVSYLSNAISKTEDEAQAGIEPGSNGVNILTIHQAKGLEFPAVFLYKCDDFTSVNKVKSKSFTIDKDFGLLSKVPLNDNYFGEYYSAPIAGLYNLIESKKDIAEIKRLFYVAVTRAKDFLFISQTINKSFKSHSFSGLLNEALKPDYKNEIYHLEGELTFLEKTGDAYINKTKQISIDIPIVRDIEVPDLPDTEHKIDLSTHKFYLSEIKDSSIGEVISATRFSTYYSCPQKYNLLYNFKVGDLVSDSVKLSSGYNSEYQDEYNRNELDSYLFDDESIYPGLSKLKGKVIHYILSKNVRKEKLSALVENRMRNSVDEKNLNQVRNEILEDLLKYYESKQFEFINSFSNYKNEHELYLKEKDYYLFGILDKLIFDNRKQIIVDYKTDSLKKEEINNRAEKYLPQLKFYAYIISRIFKEIQEIECRIIFLKFPENPALFKYDKNSDLEIEQTISKMIHSIRTGEYPLNAEKCNQCLFVNDETCINADTKNKFNVSI